MFEMLGEAGDKNTCKSTSMANYCDGPYDDLMYNLASLAMKPFPHFIEEFSSPSVRQFHIALAPSAFLQVLELVLDALRNPPALDQVTVNVLARRVGAHALGR